MNKVVSTGVYTVFHCTGYAIAVKHNIVLHCTVLYCTVVLYIIQCSVHAVYTVQ